MKETKQIMECSYLNCSNIHLTCQIDRNNLTTYHIMTDGTKEKCYEIKGGKII
ncbi:MAG: hypothetical protein ACRCX2_38565 [Paraclostridium sp.]